MDLSNIELEEFLASSEENASAPCLLPRNIVVPLGSGSSFTVLRSANGYSIILLDASSGDVAAVDSNGTEAGYYLGNSLIVHRDHGGQGLATALVLWAYKFRTALPASRSLSEGGRAAMTAAWNVARGHLTNPWWP